MNDTFSDSNWRNFELSPNFRLVSSSNNCWTSLYWFPMARDALRPAAAINSAVSSCSVPIWKLNLNISPASHKVSFNFKNSNIIWYSSLHSKISSMLKKCFLFGWSFLVTRRCQKDSNVIRFGHSSQHTPVFVRFQTTARDTGSIWDMLHTQIAEIFICLFIQIDFYRIYLVI